MLPLQRGEVGGDGFLFVGVDVTVYGDEGGAELAEEVNVAGTHGGGGVCGEVVLRGTLERGWDTLGKVRIFRAVAGDKGVQLLGGERHL